MRNSLYYIFIVCLISIFLILGLIIYETIAKKYKYKIKNLVKIIILLVIIGFACGRVQANLQVSEQKSQKLYIDSMRDIVKKEEHMTIDYDKANNTLIIKNNGFSISNGTLDEYLDEYIKGNEKIEKDFESVTKLKDSCIQLCDSMVNAQSKFSNVNMNTLVKCTEKKSGKDMFIIKNGTLEYNILDDVEKLKTEKKESDFLKAEAAKQASKQLEEKKVSYDTGITYEQLARTPDDYKDKKVKFSGKVVQVMEADNEIDLRIAVDGNYDTILFVGYNKDLSKTRILENDYVTVRGTSLGIYSYKSAMGGKISIPSMWVDQIDLNK